MKRPFRGKCFIQATTKRPDVGSLVDRAAANLFGTHVGDGASHPQRFDVRQSGSITVECWESLVAMPKVEQLCGTIRLNEDVGRFKIAMDDASRMSVLERIRDLGGRCGRPRP